MSRSYELGKEGERQALSFLSAQGYRILFQNYRNKKGELDFIARKKEFLCIIEVKTRQSAYDPIEAVNRQKQKKILQTTQMFLLEHHLTELPIRFDILGIVFDSGNYSFQLIEDAFQKRI